MSNTSPTVSPPLPRLTALDGLRGLAAAVVVLHHVALTTHPLSVAYRPDLRTPDLAGWAAVLTYTPLHTFWAGTEAVYVFFVLSGVVLALPFARHRVSWKSYYAKRLPRLYLPVAGAVLLSFALVQVVPRTTAADHSWWVDRHARDFGWSDVLNDARLLNTGTSGLNTALWSLTWEVLFSLMLVAYVLGARLWPRMWWAKLVGALIVLVLAAGFGLSYAMIFLPMFALGVLLAFRMDTIRESASSLRLSRTVWLSGIAGAVVCLNAVWLVRGLGAPDEPTESWLVAAALGLAVVGALGLVLLAVAAPPMQDLCNRSWVQWLGTRSFSLYLVHEPLVVSLAVVVDGRPWLVLLGSLVLSLVAADLFFRAVEAPSHRLSQMIGAAVDRRGGADVPSSPL